MISTQPMAGKGKTRRASAWSIVGIALLTAVITAVDTAIAAKPVTKKHKHRSSGAASAPGFEHANTLAELKGKNSNAPGYAPGEEGPLLEPNRSSSTVRPSVEKAKKLSLLDPKSWPFSLVPVPEIATDPDNGTTMGLLPVLLFNNEQHQINTILAPDIFYDTNVGADGHFRMFIYPSEDTQWHIIAGAAQNIAQKIDLFYSTGRKHNSLWSLDLRFYYEKDPTELFYGIGNETSKSGESNFTLKQIYGEAKLGLNITPHLQLQLMERPKYVRILHGALAPEVPYIGLLYPTVKGLDGGTEMMNRVVLAYDDRNSIDIPRTGGLYRIFYGISDRRFLSHRHTTKSGPRSAIICR